MKIDNAIRTRKKVYQELDDYLTRELEKMYVNGDIISVTALSQRCYVTRATIYRHKTLFEHLDEYRKKQQALYKRPH